MANVRDLGISVIPVAMRPMEIGPGGAFGVPAAHATAYLVCGGGGATGCVQCVCDPGTVFPNTSVGCAPPSQGRPGCADNSRKADSYHASGFTHESVAQLKQQLRARVRKEIDH